MSSPYSNLKKSRKPPILNNNRKQNAPFRNVISIESSPSPSFDEVTNIIKRDLKIIDDISLAKGLPQIKKMSKMQRNNNSESQHSGSSNSDLMALMMTKLTQLEQKVQYQKKEITHKDKQIQLLSEKIKVLEASKAVVATSKNSSDSVQNLEKKCLLLQQQVNEMEGFLNDYGMVWVGDSSSKENLPGTSVASNSGSSQEFSVPDSSLDRWKQENSLVERNSNFKVDFDLIIKNIEELNALAGDGIAKVQPTSGGARLKMPDSIPIIFYANGMAMFSGPFRPYSDGVTQQCIQDLQDGYFPSELQQRYPDGVPFTVTDKRLVYYKGKLGSFKGAGQVLGGAEAPSRLLPSDVPDNTNIKSNDEIPPEYNVESQLPGHRISIDQFVTNLPVSVIKKGKIIDIRSSLGNQLKCTDQVKDNVQEIETEAKQETKIGATDQSSSHQDITTLRIKSDQNETYILKLKFDDTIGDLRKHLIKHRPKISLKFDIVSTFPRKILNDDSLTFRQLNLIPNATLHLTKHCSSQ